MSSLFVVVPLALWAILILDVIVYIVVGPQFKHWPGSGFYCAWKHFVR
jgi:hypothetical protein